MYNFPIALQLYSVRDAMSDDFEGTLKLVKDMGYDGVEFAGIFGKSGIEIKKLCDKIGLVPISAHIPFVDMMNNPNILEIYQEIGCKYVVIPYLTPEYRPGAQKFQEVINVAKMLGEKAKDLGMQLCYHNHDFEFVKLDGEYALDILYNEVKTELLQPEFDTCWVSIAGESPVKYIEKYANRIDLLHLKDFVGSESENMYALIGIDDEEKKETAGNFEYRPLGKGIQKFPEILEAAANSGTKWIIVEQDEPSRGLTPIECATISIDYLNYLKKRKNFD